MNATEHEVTSMDNDHSAYIVDLSHAQQFKRSIETAQALSASERQMLLGAVTRWLNVMPFEYLLIHQCPHGHLTMQVCSAGKLPEVLGETFDLIEGRTCWWSLMLDLPGKRVFEQLLRERPHEQVLIQDSDLQAPIGETLH